MGFRFSVKAFGVKVFCGRELRVWGLGLPRIKMRILQSSVNRAGFVRRFVESPSSSLLHFVFRGLLKGLANPMRSS